MKTYLIALRTKAWRTSSSRYNAARRLRLRELSSTISLALFSSLSVVIAFVQLVYFKDKPEINNYLTSLSASLGIFLLAISLIEQGAANGAKAEALHQNAEELNDFQESIALLLAKTDAQESITWNEVEAYRLKYQTIKTSCKFNHEPIDNQLFLAEQREADEFLKKDGTARISCWQAFQIKWKWRIASIRYFGVLWLIIALAIIFSPL